MVFNSISGTAKFDHNVSLNDFNWSEFSQKWYLACQVARISLGIINLLPSIISGKTAGWTHAKTYPTLQRPALFRTLLLPTRGFPPEAAEECKPISFSCWSGAPWGSQTSSLIWLPHFCWSRQRNASGTGGCILFLASCRNESRQFSKRLQTWELSQSCQ